MPRWILVFLVIPTVWWVSGCREREENLPQFNHAMKTTDNASFTPLRVPDSVFDKKSIIKPAAAAGEASARARSPKGQAADVEIDDSSAEGTARAYVNLLAKGDIRRLTDLIDPDQQQLFTEYVNAIEPLVQAADEFRRVLDEKLPNNEIKFSLPTQLGQMVVDGVESDASDENKAKAILTNEGKTVTIPLDLRSVNGKWRITDPIVDKLAAQEGWAEKLNGMTQLTKDLLTGLQDGTITSQDEVAEKLKQFMTGG